MLPPVGLYRRPVATDADVYIHGAKRRGKYVYTDFVANIAYKAAMLATDGLV